MSPDEPTQIDGGGSQPASARSTASSTPTPVPASTEAPPTVSADPAGDELVGQLAVLAELHRTGSLTDAEFGAAKSRVLERPASRSTVPRMTLHLPTRRLVPEVHPRGAITRVSLVVLDQVARRLGATVRPITDVPIQVALDVREQEPSDEPRRPAGNGRPTVSLH